VLSTKFGLFGQLKISGIFFPFERIILKTPTKTQLVKCKIMAYNLIMFDHILQMHLVKTNVTL
jgi:hypothetical protein